MFTVAGLFTVHTCARDGEFVKFCVLCHLDATHSINKSLLRERLELCLFLMTDEDIIDYGLGISRALVPWGNISFGGHEMSCGMD